MSRSDNSRPLRLQWDDLTVAARVQHNHTTRHMYRAEDGTLKEYFVLHECDYTPSNNTINFKSKKHQLRGTSVHLRCQRKTFAYGGKNSVSGHAKIERKFRRRKLRQRERAALEQVKKSCYMDDFDLLPVREDARTILFDLD